MKCKNCHTALPDFGRFEKRVCPNCGAPVTEKPAVAKQATDCKHFKRPDDTGVTAAQDRTLWNMLAFMGCIWLLFVFSVVMIHLWESAIYLMLLCFLGAGISAILFFVNLVQALLLRRHVPPIARAPFGTDLLKIFLFSALALVGFFLASAGISETAYYNKNQDSFVQVQAQISKIKVTTDSDGDEDHDVYLTFSLDDREYKDVKYSKYSSSMREGDMLSITVDPADPEDLPSKGTGSIIVGLIIFTLFLSLLCFSTIKPLLKRMHT